MSLRLRNICQWTVQNTFRRRLTTEPKTSKRSNTSQSTEKLSINLSDACIKKLAEISKSEKNQQFLRVIVDGGGCSGFQYKFELDNKMNDDDIAFGGNGNKVIVDAISLSYCAGATIDYQTELIKSGFRVIGNPKAEQGCSCGASFALKMD